MYITLVFFSCFLPSDQLLWLHAGVQEGCYSTRIRCALCWRGIRATNSISLDPVASCRRPDYVGFAGSFVDADVLLLLLVVVLRTSKSLDSVAALWWLMLQHAVHLSMLRCYCSMLLMLAGLLPSLFPDSWELLLAAVSFIPAPRHWHVRLLCSALRIFRTLISEVGHGYLGTLGRKMSWTHSTFFSQCPYGAIIWRHRSICLRFPLTWRKYLRFVIFCTKPASLPRLLRFLSVRQNPQIMSYPWSAVSFSIRFLALRNLGGHHTWSISA